jgi:hypothetical protein
MQTQPIKPLTMLGALARGFETVGTQPLLVLLPVLSDVFYWLGPRLTLQGAAQPALAMLDDPSFKETITPDQIPALRDLITSLAASFNAYAARPPFPLGLPRLFGILHPGLTPIPAVIASADSGDVIVVPALVATLIGLVLMAIYMGLIAQQISPNRQPMNEWIQRLPRYVLMLLGLLLLDISAGLGILIALSLIVTVFLLLGLSFILAIAQFALLTALLWIILGTTLAMFTIFLDDAPLSQALRRSLLVLRLNSGRLIGMILIAGGISLLLGNIWVLPSSDSWVTLGSIIGQAIVSTGLITGVFIFYQDRYRDVMSRQVQSSVQQVTIEGST